MVNSKPHQRLRASAQSVTLTRCRPGKVYTVVLVALTQTDEAKKASRVGSRSRSRHSQHSTPSAVLTEDDVDVNFDEAASPPLSVSLHSSGIRGALGGLSARFVETAGAEGSGGYISVEWKLASDSAGLVRQIDVRWTIDGETRVHQKTMDAKMRSTKLGKVKSA